MMDRILRGALLGTFLGIVGGLAIGGLTYQRVDWNKDNTAVLAMNEGVLGDDTKEDILTDGEDTASANLTDGILRFHIRANSDSIQDQVLKLNVKDYTLSMISPIMEEAESLEKAKELILAKMPYIKTQLETYLLEAGYNYNVEIYFTQEYFPMKQYGDMTFPAGKYTALRVDIGETEGQNWWCVMYPSLCFLDATHAVLPEEGKERMKELLTEEEYEELMASNGEGSIATDDSKNVVYYHSKVFDPIKGWFE